MLPPTPCLLSELDPSLEEAKEQDELSPGVSFCLFCRVAVHVDALMLPMWNEWRTSYCLGNERAAPRNPLRKKDVRGGGGRKASPLASS